jgi:hypothetical protein
MRVILKWKGISKFCEWNFNSLDLVAIIQKKKSHFMQDIEYICIPTWFVDTHTTSNEVCEEQNKDFDKWKHLYQKYIFKRLIIRYAFDPSQE